ncbi:MAG: hypothetical protein ABIH25_04850 [Candidatus Woesearchaeota archaeon]
MAKNAKDILGVEVEVDVTRKKGGVLERYTEKGLVDSFEPEKYINLKNIASEPFVGSFSGIEEIRVRDSGDVIYQNDEVVAAYRGRVPLSDEQMEKLRQKGYWNF